MSTNNHEQMSTVHLRLTQFTILFPGGLNKYYLITITIRKLLNLKNYVSNIYVKYSKNIVFDNIIDFSDLCCKYGISS